MKLLFATVGALSLLMTGFLSLNQTNQPTVTSIRAFEEPLVAIGGDNEANKDSSLISALQTYQQRKTYEDVSAITSYLDANPQSPWKFSLLANLGIVYRKTGHFSKAIDSWELAWSLGKGEKDVKVQALANRVAGNLAALLSSLGRTERLDALLAETKGRTIYGSSSTELMTTNENLWLMKNKPGDSFKCGPYALESILSAKDKKLAHGRIILEAQSSTKGFSLTQVRDLSNKLKMNYQMAKREPGAEFIIPSVVHWKSGHYAALIKKQGDLYLTKDPTFAQRTLVTADALEDECSGYFLVPNGPLPAGWQAISDAEGDSVWGRGNPPHVTTGATKPNDLTCKCKGGGPGGGSGLGLGGGSGAGGNSGGGGSTGGGGTNLSPGSSQSPTRMAQYDAFLMLVSLSISDTPVGYTPPVGPDVQFSITYNQLEYGQPGTFTFFNFGPSWNCSWLSYVLVPTSSGATATLYTRGGGQETYSAATTSTTDSRGFTNYYDNQLQGQATLWVNGTTYERRFPDGSKEVFGQPDSPTSPVRVFLTAIYDAKGNHIDLGYDTTSSYYSSTGNLRLTTVTDALGLQTGLVYGLSADPLKVTQINDPYGRSATFAYSTSPPYQLTSITDVIGITSSFTYGTGSVITQMKTPYGITSFSSSSGDLNGVGTPQYRTLTVTEPDGSEIDLESRLNTIGYPGFSETCPTGSGTLWNADNVDYLSYRNTYYWDKKAMQATGNAPETDYTKSHLYHFLHTADATAESPILESEKPSLENRIWYQYPGQLSSRSDATLYEGTSAAPTIIGRMIDNYHQQFWRYQYNNTLNPAALTAYIDPTGRQTNYSYDTTTGIDLTGITQTTGTSSTDTLQAITYNNSVNPPHCPVTITDAAGQTTSYTYNSQGQVLTITPPVRSGHSAEMTTYTYTGNYLTSITGPISGATTTFAYDVALTGAQYNRILKVWDPEAPVTGTPTRQYTYDKLDRVILITYPDTTTDTFSYANPLSNAYGVTGAFDLDLHYSTDRVGQTTDYGYDSTRHLTSLVDPKGQTTSYTWCSCGSMTSLTDPKGNVTYFNRDLESRLTSKVYPGGTQPPTAPDYTYDVVGRVATYTDKRGDVATYSYNLDNTLSGVSYSVASGTAATPNVSYGYDTNYNRLTSVGGVSMSYVAAGSLGALKPATVTNTMTGGTAAIAYTYDEWGRVVGRNISSANNETTVFDSLGRVSSITNLLCPSGTSFTYSYFDPTHPTSRIGTISYPNGQSTAFNYFGTTGDERLQEIKNLNPSSAVLSQNDYTYSADGKIATWQQQVDSNTPLTWTEGYDAANQLTSAVLTNTNITSPPIRSDIYAYDAAGNPTTFNVSGVSRSPSYNALNQLTGSTPSGSRSVGFTGQLSGAATVTVNGSAATNSGIYFSGLASLATASTNNVYTVPVVATDAHGNSRTNKYQATVPGELTYSPTYDADGNESSNGAGQAYTWDAKNELMSIVYTAGPNSGNHTEFAYDALGRRILIAEKTGTTVGSGTGISTKQLVWNGTVLAEERNASNVPTKKFFAQGERISTTSYYYTRDHLGSVREMTDSSGTIQARYDYDPFGRMTKLAGSLDSDFQYAGYYEHASSGLNLTMFRAYDPNTAKWLSRDPAGEDQGTNLYNYVADDPVDWIDPWGLTPAGYGPAGSQTGTAALDTDGSGQPAAGEGTHGNDTSYEPGGNPLNGDTTPYAAQNQNADGSYTYPPGTTVYAVNNNTGASAFGVLGDNATPNNNSTGRVEVSPAMASLLGVAQKNNKGQYKNSTKPDSITVYYYPKHKPPPKSKCP